jgi:hypothetical protein
MAKFISVPTEIEAEQFFPDKKPWPDGVKEMARAGEEPPTWYIKDKEQRNSVIWVNPSDWIITGTQGEKYPCSDRVFKQKYRSVK